MADPRYILVIDDEATRAFVSLLLMNEGYDVLTATDGKMALDQLTDCTPTLILLDMRMPQMDGVAFVDAYHNRPELHAPIILMTAGRETPDSALTLNIAGFLAKPFNLDALLSLVERYIP